MNRHAGVLLHISSLPGRFGIGTLGAPAYLFLDFLSSSGFSAWQILPINPLGEGFSPYQSPASLRANPLLLDPDILVARGLLSQNELPACIDPTFVDYPYITAEWERMLSLASARSGEADFIEAEFYRQWSALQTYAHARGIEIIGDLPIYVAPNSEDVFENPQLFLQNVVSGCPPDAFSPTGQRWNNPLYDWEAMQKDGYRFWITRMAHAQKLFDRIRLDHFRGFVAYWAIPTDAPDASFGHWMPGPGEALFHALFRAMGRLPLIAEDLGYITEDVHALRRALHIPGMAVLQFAFDTPENPYLPEHITEDTVCYTGTHDNDTTLGWAQSDGTAPRRAMDYFRITHRESLLDAMVCAALASPAQLTVLPMQDLLRQGCRYRMNTPGTTVGNWRYRIHADQLTDKLMEHCYSLLQNTRRL